MSPVPVQKCVTGSRFLHRLLPHTHFFVYYDYLAVHLPVFSLHTSEYARHHTLRPCHLPYFLSCLSFPTNPLLLHDELLFFFFKISYSLSTSFLFLLRSLSLTHTLFYTCYLFSYMSDTCRILVTPPYCQLEVVLVIVKIYLVSFNFLFGSS